MPINVTVLPCRESNEDCYEARITFYLAGYSIIAPKTPDKNILRPTEVLAAIPRQKIRALATPLVREQPLETSISLH